MDKNTKNQLIKLFWSFLKTGIIGFGGGPSVIPLIKYEVVERHKWLTDEKFNQTFSLANVLPGPIATKMAAYIGFQLKGVIGLLVAVIAHIVPSTVAVIFLLTMVNELSRSPIVQGMISAVIPVVAVLLGIMAYEFMEKTWKGLGYLGAILTFIIVLLLLEFVQLHSAIVIIAFIAYGMTHHKWRKLLKKKKGEM